MRYFHGRMIEVFKCGTWCQTYLLDHRLGNGEVLLTISGPETISYMGKEAREIDGSNLKLELGKTNE